MHMYFVIGIRRATRNLSRKGPGWLRSAVPILRPWNWYDVLETQTRRPTTCLYDDKNERTGVLEIED